MSENGPDRYTSSAEDFLVEALLNAVEASNGKPKRWQFAILALITSLELSLKARLYAVHPVLIRENLDTKKRTINLTVALQRLKDPDIVGLRIPENAEKSIASAVDMRNNLAHAISFTNEKAAAAKFFEVFAFLRFFFSTELNRKIDEIVDNETFISLISILHERQELRKHAEDSILSKEAVWRCPECRQDFLVQRDEQFVCLYCLHRESVADCADCNSSTPEFQLYEVSEYFEYSFEDGSARLLNNFGFPDITVCEDCLQRRRKQIDEIKYRDSVEDVYFYSILG